MGRRQSFRYVLPRLVCSFLIDLAAKDLISHLLCVDPAQRYTIDEFLAHPWCNAAPAPPPPPTPFIYGNLSGPPYGAPLDSPLLSAARGGRTHEGRSPGIATLKEAFEITYAVHRMEEEGARRRRHVRGGAGGRGFLNRLNEDDEDEEPEEDEGDDSELEEQNNHLMRYHPQQHLQNPSLGDQQAHQAHHSVMDGRAGPRDQGQRQGRIFAATGAGTSSASGGSATTAVATSKPRTSGRSKGHRAFELDIHNATLLGRRHGKGSVGISSPLKKMEGLRMDDSTPVMREKERKLPEGKPMWI